MQLSEPVLVAFKDEILEVQCWQALDTLIGSHIVRSYQPTAANKLETLNAVTEGIGSEDMHQVELSYLTMCGRSYVISRASHRI